MACWSSCPPRSCRSRRSPSPRALSRRLRAHVDQPISLKLTTCQLGAPRRRGEGLRIGVVRRPPRGVRKADYARLDYYDVWLPLLAPSADLLSWIHARGADDDAAWQRFVARYRTQMRTHTDARQAIALLARLAHTTPIALGCHCANESRCHRSVLHQLIIEAVEAAP